MSLLFDIGSAFLSKKSSNKQQKKNIADYGAAETGSLNALTGARDSSLTALTGARDSSVAGYQPFLQGGTTAFNNALAMQTPGYEFSATDPSYAWRFNEGQRAVDQSAAARGGLGSGGTLKALTRYGQGLASTEYGNQFDRNARLANAGLQAAQGNASAQSGYASGVSGIEGGYAGGVNNVLFGAADGRSGARNVIGNNNAGFWGSVGGSFRSAENTLGSFFGF